MVNNYPEYAAGISYQKAEENVKHFYNAQVKVDPSDDSMSAVLTKDGEVISELPDGGGGSSDFSTANVTIQAGNIGDGGSANLVVIDDDFGIYPGQVEGSSPGSYVAILYNGSQIVEMDPDVYNSSSGACTYNSDEGLLTITGDCTIAMNYSSPA